MQTVESMQRTERGAGLSPAKGWSNERKKEKLNRTSSFFGRLRSKSGRTQFQEGSQGSARLGRKGSVVQLLSRSFSMPNVKKKTAGNPEGMKEEFSVKFLSPWRATCGRCEGSGVDFLGIRCSCVREREVIRRKGESSLLKFLELGHPLEVGEHRSIASAALDTNDEGKNEAKTQEGELTLPSLIGSFSVSNIQAELSANEGFLDAE